jgi:hypothetical protein
MLHRSKDAAPPSKPMSARSRPDRDAGADPARERLFDIY